MEQVQTGVEPKLQSRSRRLVLWPKDPPALVPMVPLALAPTSTLAGYLDLLSQVVEWLESELADLTAKERRAEEAHTRRYDDALILETEGTAEVKKAKARRAARAERDAWMDIQDEMEGVNRRLKGLTGRHNAVSRVIAARQGG